MTMSSFLAAAFFVPALDPARGEAVLPDEEGRHLTRVLRLSIGDEIAVFDGNGREFRAIDIPMFVRVMTAPLVMLSLWKCSFGPCSAKPIDAKDYIDTTVDTFVTSLKCGAPNSAADATECVNRSVKRSGLRTTR